MKVHATLNDGTVVLIMPEATARLLGNIASHCIVGPTRDHTGKLLTRGLTDEFFTALSLAGLASSQYDGEFMAKVRKPVGDAPFPTIYFKE